MITSPRPTTLIRCCLPLAMMALGVAGCTVGPDYEPPQYAVPDTWQSAVEAEMTAGAPDIERWWESFNDSTLTQLIQRAELANLDLQSAAARVMESQAIRGVATGDQWPDLVFDGSYSRLQLSENGLQPVPEGTEVEPVSLWSPGLSTVWEIDLFGRIRRQVESATAAVGASVEDYRDVLVSLYAEVALTYIDLRTSQTRLAYARSNADAQQESVDLTRSRFGAGLTSALDVAQAQRNLASTRAEIPTLRSAVVASVNRLSVLLGEAPGSLESVMEGPATFPEPDSAVALGVPVDLLRRRPDIRRAERTLASQTALIGVATADLYPRFSISGFLGLESVNFSDLGNGGSVTWGIVPGFSWSLFSGGKVQNRIKTEEARTLQALFAYERTVLIALEEVGSGIVAYQREEERLVRLHEAVVAAQEAVDLVHTQYLAGLTNFQNVLDAQRSLFNEQDRLASSHGQVLKNLIGLNLALGGGWHVPEDENQLDAAKTLVESSHIEDAP